MNRNEILELLETWKNERYFDHYYHSGVYHKKILELLKLNTIKDLKVYLLKLKPSSEIDLKTNVEYLKIKKEEEELNIRHEKNDDSRIWSSERLVITNIYKGLLSDIQERLKPFIEIANKYKIDSKAYEELFRFFFVHYDIDKDQADFDQIILLLRRFRSRQRYRMASLDDNWCALVSKALAYPDYDKMKIDGHETDYQILSAYLLRLQNALKFNSYRIDELGRVHLDLKNNILATLTIIKMPIKTNFNEFELGELKQTQPVSNSGYDNNLYVISDLNLYFEGYHLHFSFEAFAVLSNGFDINFNASSRVRDNLEEIWG